MISTHIVQFQAHFHLPRSDLRSEQYSLSCDPKPGTFPSNLALFHTDLTNICLVANLNAGGERADKTGQSRYWSSHDRYWIGTKLQQKLLHIQVSAGEESLMAGAEMSCMVGADMSCIAGVEMSCMARDGDVLCGRRWLLTLIRANGIQLYLHSHIYWPCGPLR